ncbi:hypothetical protein [Agarivorans sp. QJM3NY_25]|uniref:hypothetical protein n=1 Tax=Agarivorans sp. QJM3NY_25 TaxID=3421430 RepID=UPI003D7D9421
MIVTISLKADLPETVSRTGRYLNLLIAAGEIRVRAMGNGSENFDSNLYKGCAPTLSAAFEIFEFTSPVDQEIKVWISKHPMTTQSSEMRSVGSENISSNQAQAFYGAPQLIAQAEPGRSTVLIQPWNDVIFIGGSNVSSANGFKVAAGEPVKISTQGAVYAVTDNPIYKRFLVPTAGEMSLQKSIPIGATNNSSHPQPQVNFIGSKLYKKDDNMLESSDFGETWVDTGVKARRTVAQTYSGLAANDFSSVTFMEEGQAHKTFALGDIGGTSIAVGASNRRAQLMVMTDFSANFTDYRASYFDSDAWHPVLIDGEHATVSAIIHYLDGFLVFVNDGTQAKLYYVEDGVSELQATLAHPIKTYDFVSATSDGRIYYHAKYGDYQFRCHELKKESGSWTSVSLHASNTYNNEILSQHLCTKGESVAYYARAEQKLKLKVDASSPWIIVDSGINAPWPVALGEGLIAGNSFYSGGLEPSGGTKINVLREVN